MFSNEPFCSDDVKTAKKTPKNIEATVISVLRLLRHKFRHANLK